MDKKPSAFEPVAITTHDDLRKNIRNINKRFNDNPEVARLLIVNPILALEDIGVQLSDEIKQHIMDSLRFPRGLKERKRKLEMELTGEISRLGVSYKLPLNAEQKADLLFNVLKLTPQPADAGDVTQLASKRTRCYKGQHPLVAKLADYERIRQGALVFHTRETYEAYKAGRRQHRWLKAVRFKT